MQTRAWLGGWIASLALAACTPAPDYLFVDPNVAPVRVELRRSFGVFHKHYEPVPLTECGFYESTLPADAARMAYTEELWRIVSTAPDVVALSLRYGVVPEGFFQATPPAGPPPPLEPGRRYTVECSGDGRGLQEFEMPELTSRPVPPLRSRP